MAEDVLVGGKLRGRKEVIEYDNNPRKDMKGRYWWV